MAQTRSWLVHLGALGEAAGDAQQPEHWSLRH
jgi:hypothetical protein